MGDRWCPGLAGLQLLENLGQDEATHRNHFLAWFQPTVDDDEVIFFLGDPDDATLKRLCFSVHSHENVVKAVVDDECRSGNDGPAWLGEGSRAFRARAYRT